VFVHGTGAFAIGDRPTARRLLIAEGAGLGVFVGAGALLAVTGASRVTTGVLAPLTLAGFSVFALSFVADVYAATTGGRDVGPAPFAPWFNTEVGYLYVYDPQFDYANLGHFRADVRFSQLRASGELWAALDDDHQRMLVELAYRALGRTPERDARDGSYADVVLGLRHRRFTQQGFAVTTPELHLHGRADLARLGASLRGAFVEGQLGAGLELYDYDVPGAEVSNDVYGLMLARVGFGLYLGDSRARTGELLGYYDHRRDDFAAGLGVAGIGSGFLGHFGVIGHCFFTRDWGATALVELGSAAVLGLGVRYRQPALGGAS
jgi:hypothetical protein